MIYTTYDNNGEFIFSVADNAEYELPSNSVIGQYNSSECYYDLNTKEIVAKPACPGQHYDWNSTEKTWFFNSDKASINVRNIRNNLLGLIDRVNPIWYQTLTDQQRLELATYRQSLLDVPQQPNFPQDVIWPHKPAWL